MDGSFEEPGDRATAQPARNGGLKAGFSALLPMRPLPRFSPGELVTVLNRILGPAGAGAELVPRLTRFEQSPGGARVWHRPKVPPRVGVDVAGITLVVEGRDRPACGLADAGALDFRSWPAGARDVARARAHVRVFEAEPALAAELDLNHDRAAALTALAVAVAELVQPAGIVWEPSGVAVPVAELTAALPALMAAEAPVALWVGVAAKPWGGVVTRGLYPLLGAEIEVRAPALSQAAAGRVAMGLAAEILESGRPPSEGARIEQGRGIGFLVRYRGAEDGGAPAVVLEEARPDTSARAAGAA